MIVLSQVQALGIFPASVHQASQAVFLLFPLLSYQLPYGNMCWAPAQMHSHCCTGIMPRRWDLWAEEMRCSGQEADQGRPPL